MAFQPTPFCAYIHSAPGVGPFYVGKGTVQRALGLKPHRRNKHHGAIVTRAGAANVHVHVIPTATEAGAFSLEKVLIQALRQQGARLANHTDGGEGMSGFRHTPATKDLLRERSTGKKQSAETLAKISAALTGRSVSAETRLKLSAVNKGRTFGPLARKNMSAARIGKPVSAASLVGLQLAAFTGHTHTPAAKAKISAARIGNTHAAGHTVSADTRARLADIQRGKRYPRETCVVCGKSVSITQMQKHLRAAHGETP